MKTRMALWLAFAFFVALLAGCAGSAAPSPPPTTPPILGTVDTPEEAVAAVVAFEPRFAGITAKQPDVIGQSSWYTVTPASGVGAYIVEIEVGWDDCQAGCINRHTWTFIVQPDGAVTLQAEDGEQVPEAAWPARGATGQTGISGMAVAGPTCPVETVGDPACAPRPVGGATVVATDRSGAAVASVVTGPDGSFFLAVPAGSYTVTGAPVGGLMGAPEPTAVTVFDGQAVLVQLSYDTGIR